MVICLMKKMMSIQVVMGYWLRVIVKLPAEGSQNVTVVSCLMMVF